MLQPRQTACDMAKGMHKFLADEKPALVIWQTGTVDAMRGVDPENFQQRSRTGSTACTRAVPTSS